jgi:hypothetical protein
MEPHDYRLASLLSQGATDIPIMQHVFDSAVDGKSPEQVVADNQARVAAQNPVVAPVAPVGSPGSAAESDDPEEAAVKAQIVQVLSTPSKTSAEELAGLQSHLTDLYANRPALPTPTPAIAPNWARAAAGLLGAILDKGHAAQLTAIPLDQGVADAGRQDAYNQASWQNQMQARQEQIVSVQNAIQSLERQDATRIGAESENRRQTLQFLYGELGNLRADQVRDMADRRSALQAYLKMPTDVNRKLLDPDDSLITDEDHAAARKDWLTTNAALIHSYPEWRAMAMSEFGPEMSAVGATATPGEAGQQARTRLDEEMLAFRNATHADRVKQVQQAVQLQSKDISLKELNIQKILASKPYWSKEAAAALAIHEATVAHLNAMANQIKTGGGKSGIAASLARIPVQSAKDLLDQANKATAKLADELSSAQRHLADLQQAKGVYKDLSGNTVTVDALGRPLQQSGPGWVFKGQRVADNDLDQSIREFTSYTTQMQQRITQANADKDAAVKDFDDKYAAAVKASQAAPAGASTGQWGMPVRVQ